MLKELLNLFSVTKSLTGKESNQNLNTAILAHHFVRPGKNWLGAFHSGSALPIKVFLPCGKYYGAMTPSDLHWEISFCESIHWKYTIIHTQRRVNKMERINLFSTWFTPTLYQLEPSNIYIFLQEKCNLESIRLPQISFLSYLQRCHIFNIKIYKAHHKKFHDIFWVEDLELTK